MKVRFSVWMHTPLLVAAMLLLASASHAVDGVVEINQTCAVTGGCFTGDTAGYPVTIDGSAGGSYRLTSNLTVPDADTHGILIETSSISVDLNGFEILRSGCEGATTNCAPAQAGSGAGIRVDDIATRFGVSVFNGSVVGMGSIGVFLGQNSEVRGVRARWNKLGGLGANHNSLLIGNTAFENDGYGLGCGAGCLFKDNSARSNTDYGLSMNIGSGYSNNVMTNNTTSSVFGGVNLGGNVCGLVACP